MPRSAASYVAENVRFTPGVTEATKAFARSKPWAGDLEQRIEKLRVYHSAMCAACEIDVPLEFASPAIDGVGAGAFVNGTVYIGGKLSVVTYLYWFAAAMYGEINNTRQMTFAINLYKQRFPRSFANADLSTGLVR